MRVKKGTYFTWLIVWLLLFPHFVQPHAASAAQETESRQLAAHIDKLLAKLAEEPESRGMTVGIAVYNLATKQYLYAHQQDKLFVPASILKLFVTVAALERLGPDYRFKTEVYAAGPLTPGGVLAGDLVLKGYGDPSFSPEDLTALVEKLRDAGVKRISGGIKVDESYFDDVRLGPAWMWDDEVYGYSAQLSGLTLNRNAVTLTIAANQEIGAAPTLTMVPANDYVTIENEVKMVEGQEADLTYARPRGQNTITVRGTLGVQGEAVEEPLAVDDPALFVGNALKHQLAAAGIALHPRVAVEKVQLSEGTPLVTHYSRPLGELLQELNKESDNFYAEALLKTLGAERKGEGSFAAGCEVVAEVLREAKIAGYRQVDGSGLSRLNLVTPDQLVKLLAYVQEQEYKQIFEASLPIAGVDGTLKNRFLETPAANRLLAKTGSMSGVNGLSGYVTAANGEKLAFAILANGIYKSQYARELQDSIGTLLARYPYLDEAEPFTPPPPQRYELAPLLDPLVQQVENSGATAGLMVKSLDRADEAALLYAHNADKLLTPAANSQLLTTLAALRELGADYRFRTELYVNGPIRPGGVLAGDLIVKGYGDPTLHTDDSAPALKGVSLEEMVERISAAGIRVIQGELIVDDLYFDDQRLGLGWTWDEESSEANAQIAALSANRGTVRIDYRPGKRIGDKVELTLTPQTEYVEIVNEAKTAAADADNTFSITRVRGQNVIRVTGNLPLSQAAGQRRIAVEDPALYMGTLLQEKLREAGIKTIRPTVKRGEVPAGSSRLAVFSSPPLAEILAYLNKHNDHHYAEMIAKALGAEKRGEGSTAAGLAVVYASAAALGVEETFDLFDASGLTRYNQIAPSQLLAALEGMADEQEFALYLESLPVAGADGTLSDRMKGTSAENNLRAKSGALLGVSALSGYVTARSGERLAFSFIVNGYTGDAEQLKAVEERIAIALANYERGETASLLPLFLQISQDRPAVSRL
ncbi:D-alanyl-D-alanine carboxypeptidase/D-alanyl-D-alanine endopeptidase [Brevibacillus marinus]|uniref:D-alanyl-D-alanine carboxypeptidase/D-alanyl-D-alanine endopeptidase n=1 Tax=Brevibacillus marinus TaxID=2496837 RepID=UPI001F49CF7B|nr:D-alanyl-D-alanine carboxypeptidase/D-alanyl-D-alanine-endopeptidase [Brevibacillus marinus]